MKYLRKFNELYDSDDVKNLKVSPQELKKMTAMDFGYRHSSDTYHGKNSSNLNTSISDYIASDSYTKFNRYGILDILHQKIINHIPELKKFKLKADLFESEKKFSYNKEILLDVPGMKDDYSIKMNYTLLCFRFHRLV